MARRQEQEPARDTITEVANNVLRMELPIRMPGLGHPFHDLAARTRAIKRHHEERLEKVKAISRGFGVPASVQAFSQQLFKPRSWGAMAESETFAHLEHLRIARAADRSEDGDGMLLYVTG